MLQGCLKTRSTLKQLLLAHTSRELYYMYVNYSVIVYDICSIFLYSYILAPERSMQKYAGDGAGIRDGNPGFVVGRCWDVGFPLRL